MKDRVNWPRRIARGAPGERPGETASPPPLSSGREIGYPGDPWVEGARFSWVSWWRHGSRAARPLRRPVALRLRGRARRRTWPTRRSPWSATAKASAPISLPSSGETSPRRAPSTRSSPVLRRRRSRTVTAGPFGSGVATASPGSSASTRAGRSSPTISPPRDHRPATRDDGDASRRAPRDHGSRRHGRLAGSTRSSETSFVRSTR